MTKVAVIYFAFIVPYLEFCGVFSMHKYYDREKWDDRIKTGYRKQDKTTSQLKSNFFLDLYAVLDKEKSNDIHDI